MYVLRFRLDAVCKTWAKYACSKIILYYLFQMKPTGCTLLIIFISTSIHVLVIHQLNPLNAELNPICHLLALLETRRILHVSRLRVDAQILVL
jgi:hypothetical protein